MSASDEADRTVVLNPSSGTAGHAEAVRKRASLLGYEVEETEAAGDAVTLAREAAAGGVSVVAAAGGDGTLNEVVRGVREAGALDRVTVGVVPTGTGNNFAKNVGITSIDEGFAALEDGERRRIDLGLANDGVFVNTCIGGLVGDAIAETPAELKTRLGGLAYVVTTLRSTGSFDGVSLTITARGDGERTPVWTGDAMFVLIGNGRRFTTHGEDQANMEDGRFDVCVIEDVSALDLVDDAVTERLFGETAPDVTRFQAPSLEISSAEPEPFHFSVDGELVQTDDLLIDVSPGALRVPVGEDYDPDPDRGSERDRASSLPEPDERGHSSP